MRKLLPLLGVFAVGLALGWVLHAPPKHADRPSPDQMNVRSIGVHVPDGAGGTRYHILKVFEVSGDFGRVRHGEPAPGNWIVTTGQQHPPGGWGQVTYYATAAD